MIDMIDMTHEELAQAAHRLAAQRDDNQLLQLARDLQSGVDAEADTASLAATIIAHIEAAA